MFDHPTLSQLPVLKQLWKLAFGDEDGFIDLFFENGFAPERCFCMEAEGKICAALYWFEGWISGQKTAYLYGVATHPDCRGQGLCRKLMEHTHRHLAAAGFHSAILVPQTEALREMYRKMGYRNCTTISEFFCTDDPYPAPIHTITAEEYARLRRQYLPQDSVIQEGESLVFLGSYTRFYQGMDFILAASVEKDTLFAPEFLGNKSRAAGVLCALGCCQGTFRTPGEKMEFAMLYPLKENAVSPSYLGFAFD